MKLSIITINYNNCNGLGKTIESVVNQTWQKFEWIIVDGGSTDGSKELIEETASQLNRQGWSTEQFSDLTNTSSFIFTPEPIHHLLWCSERDKGIYNAMNKGILKAKGDFLLFLNSGDFFVSETVLKENCASLGFDIDFVVGRVCDVSGNLSTDYTSKDFTALIVYQGPFPHQACFIRRRVFERYGIYDESYRIAADWKLYVSSIVVGTASVKFVNSIISCLQPDGASTDSVLLHHEGLRIRQELLSPYLEKNLLQCVSLNDIFATKIGKTLFRIAYRISMLLRT